MTMAQDLRDGTRRPRMAQQYSCSISREEETYTDTSLESGPQAIEQQMTETRRHVAVPGSDEFACHEGEIAKAYLVVLQNATTTALSQRKVNCQQ